MRLCNEQKEEWHKRTLAPTKGYQGFVSKTRLIEHYEKTLGATHVGGHKMVIFPQEALKLIKKYFPT